jgi:serine/threonine-protein kinase
MAVCEKCHREAPGGALFCSFCGTTIKPPTAEGEAVDPLIGQTISGKYFVHQLLGRGGMGEVYKATHLTLDKPVVLKLLKKSFLNDPSIVQRFHREARAASRLNHPNSINIIDFGQTDDGTLFMAMEYLSGRSLARVIAEDQPIPERRVVHIGAQILAALGEAHALGIIHRDLKPENAMLEARRDEPDFVKVLDFGIAKLNEPGDGAGRLTQAGIVCGTPGYMSPEQVRGDELDARSDLYSVGIILYEMLTGKLPFEADTPMGLVTKHLVEAAPPLSVRKPGLHVSPGLESLVLRCLAKDRQERPGSAEEMRAALLAWAAQGDREVRPTPPPARTMMLDAAAVPTGPAPRSDTGGIKIWRPPTAPGAGAAGATRSGPAPATSPQASQRTPPPTTVMPTPMPVGGGTVVMPTPAPQTQSSRLPPTPPPQTQMGSPPPTPAPQRHSGGMPAVAPPQAQPAQRHSGGMPAMAPPQAQPTPPTPAPQRHSGGMPATPAPQPSRKPATVSRPAPPRHEADDEEEERPASRPPARSKVPLIAGAVGVVVVLGVVGWFATRKSDEPPTPAPIAVAPPPVAPPVVPSPPPSVPPAATPPQATAVVTPPPAPPPPVVAAAPPPVATSPGPATPPHTPPAATRPHPDAVPVKPPPAPEPPPVKVAEVKRPQGKGMRSERGEINSIPTPPAATGDGVLTVTATPWGDVYLDGIKIGETPREFLLGAGDYRVRVSHPSLGNRDEKITVLPGKRKVWNATYAN